MSKKILVVDDEIELIEAMESALKAEKYEVITALDGTEGLKRAQNEKPDLIVLDIQMPVMSGDEMAQSLKDNKETKDIPIIFLSQLRTKEEEKKEGPEVGGRIVLAKPFETKTLITSIKKVAG